VEVVDGAGTGSALNAPKVLVRRQREEKAANIRIPVDLGETPTQVI
jgi:hypothetical protein